MRILLVVLLALLAAPAFADESVCSDEQQAAVTLLGWTKPKPDDRYVIVGMGLESRLDKPIVMIDADVTFVDALSAIIGGVALTVDRDLHFSANGRAVLTPNDPHLWRLREIDENLVTATLCTRAVMFADGTKQVFE